MVRKLKNILLNIGPIFFYGSIIYRMDPEFEDIEIEDSNPHGMNGTGNNDNGHTLDGGF